MTKQEYKAIRGKYKPLVVPLYKEAHERAKMEFVLSDYTLQLFEKSGAALAEFAALLGCDKLAACDVLNMR